MRLSVFHPLQRVFLGCFCYQIENLLIQKRKSFTKNKSRIIQCQKEQEHTDNSKLKENEINQAQYTMSIKYLSPSHLNMNNSKGMNEFHLPLPFMNKSSSSTHQKKDIIKKFRSKKQIYDIIQFNNNNFNTHEKHENQSKLTTINGIVDQKRQKTFLNQLYNQDIAPQDSQKTLFYYLKTLAYEMIIVLLSFVSIIVSIIMYYDFMPSLSDEQAREAIMLLTLLTMLTAGLQTQTRVKWLKQKKQKQNSAKDEYISLLIEVVLLIPCPNNYLTGEFMIHDQSGNQVIFNLDQLFTVVLLCRVIYLYKLIIHSQLYYGSRPDRLSRLYTVKFGTFNAFKFLINEKPLLIVILMFSLNLIFLPMLLLLIQGKVNPGLSTFMACLHFTVVTQVTVGYGNIQVITIFGRIVSISFILIGVTSTSLLLIFFMRLMEQTSQQQQAHLLLSSLEKRQEITKARILRIQTQYLYSKIRCAPQQKQKHEQKLRQFRFQNRRNILFQREQPANVKRMMLSNFASVIEMMNQLKQKQLILGKIIQFIIKSNNSTFNEKIVQEELLYQQQMDKNQEQKDRKPTNSKTKKKNQLMIQNNSEQMMERLGKNIRQTIISKAVVFQK